MMAVLRLYGDRGVFTLGIGVRGPSKLLRSAVNAFVVTAVVAPALERQEGNGD